MIIMYMKRYSITFVAFLTFNICFAQLGTPSNTNADVSEQDLTSENGYLGAKGRGKYSVWYGCGGGNGQARNHIRKPFIWVEGINLTPNNIFMSHHPVYPNLYFTLMENGFDIVQLDFNNNPQWIQRNAELLITLIDKLQKEMVENGSNHEIVIMGESMGGMVARYALTKMEHDGVSHNVRLYISHDSQHSGANIPWGLQYMAQDITGNNLLNFFTGTSFLAGITNTFASLFDGSGTPGLQAAFQLLRDGPMPEADELRALFVLDLKVKGNYPVGCRKIAIANGANNGIGIPVEGDNHQILRITSPSITALLADRRAHAAPGIQITLLGADLGSRIVYSKIPTTLLDLKLRFYPHGLQNWDLAPGSPAFEDETILGGIARTRPFTFTPTVSALGLNTNDPFFNVAANIPGFGNTMPNVGYTFDNNITAFDAIWANDVNYYHALLDEPGLSDFIISETSPANLVLQNKTVSNGQAKIYEASNSVILGREESPAFPVGNVVFESGSDVVIRAGNEIRWRNGFEAVSGSNVDARIDFYDCR
jgi:hypothetical protein